jgi:enterochelin esterase family protein
MSVLKLALLAALALPAVALAAPDQSETTIGPDYADAPEMAAHPDRPKGTLQTFTMESKDSRIYPGIRRLENAVTARRDDHGNRIAAPFDQESEPAPYSRQVVVYIPPGYRPGTEAPVMVVQDGPGYAPRVAAALDGLIAEHRAPAMIAVMVQSGGGDAQGSERGLEYDTVSGRYADFIEQELLPRVEKDYGVRFTHDPEGHASMGGSSGAAAAFTMAWFHPDRWRRVLSYSGTFVNQAAPVDPATPEGAWDYAAHLVPDSPKKPIRIWMEVGEKDLHWDDPESTFHNWPLSNRRMAAALKAKGYAYRFVFARDAKHVDPRVIGQTLPDAIEWLWKGYPR